MHKLRESDVLRACLDLLAADGIFALRLNTSATKVGDRFFRSHSGGAGVADIVAFVSGAWDKLFWPVLWIECKSDRGRQSVEQKSFEQKVRSEGHAYLLVRDVDVLREWLRENR